MAACTFFGHRECSASIKPKLRAVVVVELIVRYGVDRFYVGRQGAFSAYCDLSSSSDLDKSP